MRVLDELEREIARLAAEAGDVRRRRRWWRSGTLVIALPLALAAAAVAATSAILTGNPLLRGGRPRAWRVRNAWQASQAQISRYRRDR